MNTQITKLALESKIPLQRNTLQQITSTLPVQGKITLVTVKGSKVHLSSSDCKTFMTQFEHYTLCGIKYSKIQDMSL